MVKILIILTSVLALSGCASKCVSHCVFGFGPGSDAFTAPFNGGSGNLLVKPAASYIYSEPYTGATVVTSNKNFQITNEGTGTISINVVAVGVTG